MFRAQNCLRALLIVGGLALVSLPAAAQAGGGCVKFYGNGCHNFNYNCQPTYCQPNYCQPSYCQPANCYPTTTCYPYTCQPIVVQPHCKPLCYPQFQSCQPIIIHKW
ncbi:MAG TPA: hypothetical protein VFV87_07235 [Pirellulaceae bacterium]|nr:hypothetical protein [Pirellulaceae bacterium]